LSDFVTKQGVDSVYGVRPPSPDEYDPKHKALLSSSMIPGDIATLRFECDERHRPFGVLFADLDGFKAFNEALGEVRVDQTVLPPVLRAVDAAAYGHGRVYRHGGDEFVILLPNATVGLASALGDQLRHDVGALRFPGTTLLPSVSVGIWLTTPESHLTDLELVERAQEAKKAAKAEGKNRTVVLRESGDGSQKCISAD
jgi:diguanylate cyclase (GGDEF)-like protein